MAEKFCLRWNDFESNISGGFLELREDKDFFDVTIACDEDQVQAHKLILSACSPFFKSVLKRNTHQQPWLFLKGVKFSNLLSVLDFMYHGEVNVAQEDLDSFLSVAEDLKVKGLTQKEDQNKGKLRPTTPPPAPKRCIVQQPLRQKKIRIQQQTKEENDYEDDCIQVITPVKQEPGTMNNYDTEITHIAEDQIENDYQEPEPIEKYRLNTDQSYREENGVLAQYDEDNAMDDGAYNESWNDASMSENKGNEELKEILERFTKKVTNKAGEALWQCTSCHKLIKRKCHLIEHIESNHVEGLQFRCPYCTAFYRTRSSIRSHVCDKHRDEHTVYKLDMANLEWSIKTEC